MIRLSSVFMLPPTADMSAPPRHWFIRRFAALNPSHAPALEVDHASPLSTSCATDPPQNGLSAAKRRTDRQRGNGTAFSAVAPSQRPVAVHRSNTQGRYPPPHLRAQPPRALLGSTPTPRPTPLTR